MTRTVAVLAALVMLGGRVDAQRPARDEGFPHQRHERLFPLCESCHAGLTTGSSDTAMPAEASCRECHNGTDVRVVEWRRPQRRAGLLHYSHAEHAAGVDSAGRRCATCHAVPGSTRRMDVGRARPEACQGCHTHRASAHLADDNRCATCHVSLTAATGLSEERISAFPKPASHGGVAFGLRHEPAAGLASATCSVCHARESCARCHVNASGVPLIAALGRDQRVAKLTSGREAVYLEPADHRADAFVTAHGKAARSDATRCATCHARPSCTSCHIGPLGAEVVARMPVVEAGGAGGVALVLRPPNLRYARFGTPLPERSAAQSRTRVVVRVHEDGFRDHHGSQGAAGMPSCEGCHEQRFCSDCHAGEHQRRFHPANFSAQHAADSYGREADCASCHNAALFCRSCHTQVGLGSRGSLDAAFHDAQPLWLLQHGRAARQGLQSCTTCHVQRDCLTCHSTLGWGVNPHGPGFPASRLASRNATQCLMCHLRVPGP